MFAGFWKHPPYGTLVLVAAVAVAYWLLSQETLYISSADLYRFALFYQNPLTFVTHLFVHVGFYHLMGNLVPLFLFALVLESAVVWYDVIFIFLFSGIVASALFILTTPLVALAGASAGISGILGASLVLKPKQALVLLLAMPLLLSYVVFPVLTYSNQLFSESLQEKKTQVQQEYRTAVNQAQYNKSPQLQQQVQQLNQTLQSAEKNVEVQEKGKEREQGIPTDLAVHVYGVIGGLLYLWLFRPQLLKSSRKEYEALGKSIVGLVEKLKRLVQWKPKTNLKKIRRVD